ncbi:MAG: organomercurial lyase [Candidatus Dormibacterales bacterium]
MSSMELDSQASLGDFIANWRRITTDDTDEIARLTRGGYALIGLTNFGERPVTSSRLAEVMGWPVSEAEALARQGGWGTRIEDGLITVNPEGAPSAPRRYLQIGDRRVGVTGCAPDVFLYAPLVRPSLQLDETCPVTETPIRLTFTPNRVESVDPSGAVVVMPHPRELDQPESGFDLEECRTDLDGNLCSQCPFYSSAEAAQGWAAAHPGGRLFPIREAWDLSFFREWRQTMSELLNLERLSHAG